MLSPQLLHEVESRLVGSGGPRCCGGGRGGGKTLGKGDIRTGLKKEVRRHSRWRKEHQQRHRGEEPRPVLQWTCPRTIGHKVWSPPRPPGEGRGCLHTHGPEEQEEDRMCGPSSATQLLDGLGQVTSLP